MFIILGTFLKRIERVVNYQCIAENKKSISKSSDVVLFRELALRRGQIAQLEGQRLSR